MTNPNPNPPNEEFSHSVSDALSQLYDSVALQSHPLGRVLFPGETNPLRRCQLLRKTLLDAIHSLEPGPGVPGGAPDRRLYRLVELRFIEGLDPNEAMTRLALAKSQFYRDQARVLEMLAETIWSLMPSPSLPLQPVDPRSQLIHAEVERLSPNRDGESIDAAALAADLRQIISPLAEDRQIRLGEFDLAALHQKALDRVLLRQTILTALITALDLPELHTLTLSSQWDLNSCGVRVIAGLETGGTDPLPAPNDTLEACRLLAEALGGGLRIIPGKTEITFTLTWPLNPGRLLLVIDDNTGMADLFRLYVKSANWAVLSASGGREAREILRDNRPDLIMLDILMPQEDGWELLRALKTGETSKLIPVVICSVLKQPQVALKLGASAYVEKPVSQQTLLDTLARLGSGTPI
jgi:CheY-like chemotaxis protein